MCGLRLNLRSRGSPVILERLSLPIRWIFYSLESPPPYYQCRVRRSVFLIDLGKIRINLGVGSVLGTACRHRTNGRARSTPESTPPIIQRFRWFLPSHRSRTGMIEMMNAPSKVVAIFTPAIRSGEAYRRKIPPRVIVHIKVFAAATSPPITLHASVASNP